VQTKKSADMHAGSSFNNWEDHIKLGL